MKTHTKRYRAAVYLRVSSEEQIDGYSLDAQERQCREYAESRGMQIIRIYREEGQSAFRGARPSMDALLRAASEGAFDAVIVHKWDRFGRNRRDTVAYKAMLRNQYRIALYSVTETGEDDDAVSGYVVEGILEVVNHMYSMNLSREVSKAYAEKHAQGLHTRNAPFGYDKDGRLLAINEHEAQGVVLMFEAYDTGQYSYADTARLLNEQGYRTKSHGRAFTKDTVREMLRNPIYVGKVRYQQTDYNPDGTRSFRNPVHVNDGQHEAIISEDLFDRVQARMEERKHRRGRASSRPYLLRGLLYCERCMLNPPEKPIPSWGKIHSREHQSHHTRYGFCSSRSRGLQWCGQPSIHLDKLEDQVLQVLSHLQIGADWRERVINAVAEKKGARNLAEYLAELHQIAANMDYRFDRNLLVDREAHIQERWRIQEEIEKLQPLMTVPEELEYAADLLNNFSSHFAACGGDVALQHELVKLIVERVYVRDDRVSKILLTAQCRIVVVGAEMFVEDNGHIIGREGT